MKVLQTLGRHSAAGQEGIFQYKRTQTGVWIDSTVGHANLNPGRITITNAEWTAILTAIANQPNETFRLTRTNTNDPPRQSVYDTVASAVPNPVGWTWNDSWLAYVCAILEHEGSIDHYGGSLGQGIGAPIILARDP